MRTIYSYRQMKIAVFLKPLLANILRENVRMPIFRPEILRRQASLPPPTRARSDTLRRCTCRSTSSIGVWSSLSPLCCPILGDPRLGIRKPNTRNSASVADRVTHLYVLRNRQPHPRPNAYRWPSGGSPRPRTPPSHIPTTRTLVYCLSLASDPN